MVLPPMERDHSCRTPGNDARRERNRSIDHMSKATDIADDMEALVGQERYWGPTPGALYEWATDPTMGHEALGGSEETFVNCFGLPMLLAVRRGFLSKPSVKRILGDTLKRGDAKAKAFSTAWNRAVWTDWKAVPGAAWRPARGDLVFFKNFVGGLLNHVAVSTGKTSFLGHSEVISFGEGREAIGRARVNRTSIELLRQEGHTSVRFLTPTWD